MKILYHHRTQAEDGQAVHIRALIEAFEAEGHEVLEEALIKRTGSVSPPRPDSEAGPSLLGRLASAAPRFVRELAEYGYTYPARGRLLRAARGFAPDFLYERYAFGNEAGVQAAKRLGIPIVLEVNSPMVLELSRTRGLSFPRMADRVERRVFTSVTRLCVVTGVLRDMLIELGVEPERLIVTPNGVDPARFEGLDRGRARQALGLTQEHTGTVLGFVGYVRDWHRMDLVLEGLTDPALAHSRLVLVGEGPAQEGLTRRAAELGVSDRLHLAGPRPHAEIPSLLAAFDVSLVPAINPYASPLKLHEYMAAGLAVIAPDQPNLREVLVHGENALLVTPDDGDALLEALRRLVQDEELRARLGEGASRTIVEDDLTWRGNARRVVRAVEDLKA